MTSAVAALVLACLVTTVLTPWVRRYAISFGVLDQPGGRHVHEQVTPRLGGVAVIIGFFVPLAVFAVVHTGAMSGFLEQGHLVLGLVLGSMVVGVIGAVDDVRSLGPWAKLGAQAVAAVIAYAFGYRIEAVNIPLIGEISMGVFALPITVFWFLAITNAINLIDGLDGLASGIALFATISNFATAYMNDSHVVVLLSASLGGALIGFLRYNFNPAIIFLGDSGSMFLGFVLAATSLAGATTKSSTAIAILAPIIALGVPIMDTLLAMVRRTIARRSIFAADRKHIHHMLLDLGFTHRRVVLVLYGMSIALATAAMAVAFGRSAFMGASLFIAGITVFAVVRALRRGAMSAADPGNLREAFIGGLEQLKQRLVALLDQSTEAASFRLDLTGQVGQTGAIEVELRDSARDAARDESRTEREELLIFDLGVPDLTRHLQLRLIGGISMRDSEVTTAVSDFVEACREAAMRSSSTRAPATTAKFRIAAAHATPGGDD